MTASIPVHRLFVHVRRIVAAGYKVGIVKQTETLHLKAAGNNKSGPFNRQLSALYTKSTLIGEDVDPLYDSETNCETSWQSNHYLLCVCGQQEIESSASCQLGLVCVDPSTGEILYDEFTNSTAYSELETRIAHLQPVEILIPSDTSQHLMAIFQGIAALRKTDDDKIRLEIIDSDVFVPTNAVTTLTQFYSNDQSKLKDVLNLPKLVINCLAALSIYLKSFHLERVLTFTSNFCRFSQRSTHMYINKKSLLSLEIVSNSCDATEKGSLYWVLNHTCTKFGARLLRKWLAQPLLVVGEIQARLDAVQELMNGNLDGLKSMRQIMSKLPDLERGLCSIFHRKCSLTEFCIVTSALEKLRKEICCIFVPTTSSLLQTLLTGIPEYLESITWFCSQINEAAASIEVNSLSIFKGDA
uniref:DNA mismatch repair protein MutS core domain-containing protein n=1 Tax=Arion vulgaris TaxID=1028688 RepID=A0A0B7BQM4_9EUPU